MELKNTPTPAGSPPSRARRPGTTRRRIIWNDRAMVALIRFGALRTLPANIAVELPEAVNDGTLYRVLFLAALPLFAMTFCVKTIAELVPERFRKRALQL